MATFGQNLKRVRESRGVTQEVLAKRLGLRRPSQISLVENSHLLPRPETIATYAEALKAEPGELLDGVETDYDRLRKGLPLEQKPRPLSQRKQAMGESPPLRQTPAKGRRARSA